MKRFWYFVFVYGFFTVLFWSAFLDYLSPRAESPRLSAHPAPHLPHLEAGWLSIPSMERYATTYRLGRGDSLAALFARQGVSAVEIDRSLDSLVDLFDSRRLQPGQRVRVFWERSAAVRERFAGFDFIPHPRSRIIVRRLNGPDFIAYQVGRALLEKFFLAEGLITDNVYETARVSGLSPKLVLDLIHLFSYSLDFQRSIREGDTLEVLFTRHFDSHHNFAADGLILYATLTAGGKRHEFWAFFDDDGIPHYYDRMGVSVQRLLVRTPVDGARLSSRFGVRTHPILGFSRLHRGVDFAAPLGTPVFAAGDGEIIERGNSPRLGKHVRIRHIDDFETVYGHLHRFSESFMIGDRVRQGDIIGQVGRTGLTNGSQLHYEVWHDFKALDPQKLELPKSASLSGSDLARFMVQRDQIAQRISVIAAARENLLAGADFGRFSTNPASR